MPNALARPRFPRWAPLIGLLLFAVLAGSAAAHASLVRSDPPNGALVGPALQRVVAWFDLPLQAGTSGLWVYDASGAQVSLGDGGVDPADAGRQSMVAYLPGPLRPGLYTARWHALSDEGLHTGHVTEGQFSFWAGEQMSLLSPGWALAGLALGGGLASLGLLWAGGRAPRRS